MTDKEDKMEDPVRHASAIRTPEEMRVIAETMNAAMAKWADHLEAYAKCHTAKLLLLVLCGYSNEEADKKIQEMLKKSSKI
jgi:hypothetical protein